MLNGVRRPRQYPHELAKTVTVCTAEEICDLPPGWARQALQQRRSPDRWQRSLGRQQARSRCSREGGEVTRLEQLRHLSQELNRQGWQKGRQCIRRLLLLLLLLLLLMLKLVLPLLLLRL